MSTLVKGPQLCKGDVVVVHWRPYTDTIVDIRPYTGTHKDIACSVATFAQLTIGMTIEIDSTYEVINRNSVSGSPSSY